ncbi:MAG: bifunctional adenosylcobinamide kinase/adenosylcobinamide-phosphate guanylyltransferase [Roseburia sp.]|nr:bifunctional adenosylcobinamide kinase/adenosylcobinamide-phosphate guanylyltransferase [Roseburia sp.]
MIYLLTGGSGSGKSAYAEEKICSFGNYNRIYLATMESGDGESQKRIERHRELRQGKNFTTIEQGRNLKTVKIPEGSVVLLECLSNLLANEMYSPEGAGENAVREILEGIDQIDQQAKELVVVSNEVFSDMPVDREMKRYLSYLGEINADLAKKAAEVVEVVYGIPVFVKR